MPPPGQFGNADSSEEFDDQAWDDNEVDPLKRAAQREAHHRHIKKHAIRYVFAFLLFLSTLLLGSECYRSIEAPTQLRRQKESEAEYAVLRETLSPEQYQEHLVENGGSYKAEILDFDTALFWWWQTMTTIGYGTNCPTTKEGMWFIIMFGTFSIFIFGVFMTAQFNLIQALLPPNWGEHSWGWVVAFILLFILNATLWLVWLMNDDEWDFTMSAYHMMVTFSTIGYGDLAPVESIWCFILGSYVGMIGFTVVLNIAGTWVEEFFEYIDDKCGYGDVDSQETFAEPEPQSPDENTPHGLQMKAHKHDKKAGVVFKRREEKFRAFTDEKRHRKGSGQL